MANRMHDAWEQIFEEKKFDLTQDLHYITADEIKRITGEEARLMAKSDSRKDLPKVMRDNGYFLLAVNNGRYAIVRGEGFYNIEDAADPVEYESRIKFNLSTAMRNTSEMQYLDYCFASGLMEEVIGRGVLYSSIRGRERSGTFTFRVNSSELTVDGVQIEVDLGLEGEDCIVVLEAKARNMQDFIIRQLYYPYRRFKNLSATKRIIPVFFTYDQTQDTYNFWIYEFTDLTDYNSLRLIDAASYRIVTRDEIDLDDIQPASIEYKDIIPQANDLDKVMELVFKVSEGLDGAQAIADYFDFNTRQSSYYREAAEALGLVRMDGSTYQITSAGEHLTNLEAQDRNVYFSQVLANFKLVKDGLDMLRAKSALRREDIERLIEQNSNLSGSTIRRRADSLMSWYRWISKKTGTLVIENGELRSA